MDPPAPHPRYRTRLLAARVAAATLCAPFLYYAALTVQRVVEHPPRSGKPPRLHSPIDDVLAYLIFPFVVTSAVGHLYHRFERDGFLCLVVVLMHLALLSYGAFLLIGALATV